ncbi:transcription factor TFIID complex subunit 8 C-term-domain-containing protein [Lipomyces japonicus]|uniref:transcription factor TFIID complex subunit 8 C-term-domain-containing protein n=1 Tax=Lipomyces japonicus TaxID=56871 RepID=UPI0034CD62FD
MVDRPSSNGDILVPPVAVILRSLDVRCTSGALEMMAILTEEYLLHLSEKLHKYAQLQRRSKPSAHDVAFLFTDEGIHTAKLEDELDRSKKVSTAESMADGAGYYYKDRHEKSDRRTHGEPALELLQGPTKPRDLPYVPAWMPPFPADHTYQATPQYVSRITSPREIREKILKEGQLVEEALRRLIEITTTAATGDREATGLHDNNDRQVKKRENGHGTATGVVEDSDEDEREHDKRTKKSQFDIVALARNKKPQPQPQSKPKPKPKSKPIRPIILKLGKK